MTNLKTCRDNPYTFVALVFAVCLAVTTSCSKQERDPAMLDKNTQTMNCANQLRMFANAKKLWAEQNNKTADDTPTMDDIRPLIRGSTTCPGGGTYTLGKVADLPTCSIPEHQAAFTKMMQEQSTPAAQ